MNAVVGTLLLVQVWSVAPTPSTIGDTVVLEREIAVADPTASLRLAPIEGSLLVEPLAGPEAITASDGFIVRYVVALFETGDHTIPMPDIELVYPTGRLETRVGGEAFVTVLSVLPQGESLPAPRASREPIPRNVLRTAPAILLVMGVVALTVGWGLMRRRSRVRPVWAGVGKGGEDASPVSRWIAAGEPRAVATVTTHEVRVRVQQYVPEADPSLDLEDWLHTVEAHRPDWPLRELSEVMQALERASFAPAIPSDVIALTDEAQVIVQTIEESESASEEGEE
ncbi:MAG: hypothetical protein IIB90_01090 [Gemmatimonadetes bacterium]|nr:hypothetical protein [Gemmatimonadota bacterium]